MGSYIGSLMEDRAVRDKFSMTSIVCSISYRTERRYRHAASPARPEPSNSTEVGSEVTTVEFVKSYESPVICHNESGGRTGEMRVPVAIPPPRSITSNVCVSSKMTRSLAMVNGAEITIVGRGQGVAVHCA
jgi:hypothetical protein